MVNFQVFDARDVQVPGRRITNGGSAATSWELDLPMGTVGSCLSWHGKLFPQRSASQNIETKWCKIKGMVDSRFFGRNAWINWGIYWYSKGVVIARNFLRRDYGDYLGHGWTSGRVEGSFHTWQRRLLPLLSSHSPGDRVGWLGRDQPPMQPVVTMAGLSSNAEPRRIAFAHLKLRWSCGLWSTLLWPTSVDKRQHNMRTSGSNGPRRSA